MKKLFFVLLMFFATSGFSADKYAVISHAPDSDSWWNSIKNAIKHVEEDFNVDVDYKNPGAGNLSEMARLVEQSAARNYVGISMPISDYDVLIGAINKVQRKGIPMVTFNSGTQEQSEKIGAVMHVGQPEYFAGFKAGEKAKKDVNAKTFLCTNHAATNPITFERCKGFADAIGANYEASTIDTGTDPTGIESKVFAYLRKNPNTDAVLSIGPTSAEPTYKALKKLGLIGKIYFGSFDLSEQIAKGIESGGMAFGIDQQPYIQGYVPTAILATMKESGVKTAKEAWEILSKNPKFQKRLKTYGLTPQFDGKRHVNSGPGFIVKDNLSIVKKYAGVYR